MNILLIGNAGATNLGDDALLGGFVVMLREYIGDAHITMLSSDPAATRELYRVDAEHFLPFGLRSLLKAKDTVKATINAFKQADLIIHGGGGLYTDSKNIYPALLWGSHMLLAQRLRRPYLCMGQSVGPLRTRAGKSIARGVFQRAKGVVVRDQESSQLLSTLDVHTPVTVGPDAAFLLPPIEHIVPIEERNNTIILSLRPWECTESILYKLIPLIEQCCEEGLEVAFLPMQQIREEDISVYNTLRSYTEAPIILLEPKHFSDAIGYIANATMLIGMRLHSCIFATMTATPFLALSYSDKVSNFVHSVGLPEQVVEAAHVSFPLLLNSTQKTLTTLHALHNHLSKKRLALHQEAHETYGNFLTSRLGLTLAADLPNPPM